MEVIKGQQMVILPLQIQELHLDINYVKSYDVSYKFQEEVKVLGLCWQSNYNMLHYRGFYLVVYNI